MNYYVIETATEWIVLRLGPDATGGKCLLHPRPEMPTLKQRRDWHPPATTARAVFERCKTLGHRLRYIKDEYNADIVQMEILPFLKAAALAEGVRDAIRTRCTISKP